VAQTSHIILATSQDEESTISTSDHHPSFSNHTSDHQPIIIITTVKNSPPPYSSADQASSQHPTAIEANALLDRLTERVNEDHVLVGEDYPTGVQTIPDRETERIRNMLEFTLAVDYQGYAAASMSAVDREHFM
jgi:hypothetical protein